MLWQKNRILGGHIFYGGHGSQINIFEKILMSRVQTLQPLIMTAETLGDPYHKQVPLPRIPDYRDLASEPATSTSVERKRAQRMSQLGRARLKRRADMLQRFTSELEQ